MVRTCVTNFTQRQYHTSNTRVLVFRNLGTENRDMFVFNADNEVAGYRLVTTQPFRLHQNCVIMRRSKYKIQRKFSRLSSTAFSPHSATPLISRPRPNPPPCFQPAFTGRTIGQTGNYHSSKFSDFFSRN